MIARRALATLAAVASLTAPVLARHGSAHWVHVQYDAMRQVDVSCAVGYLCDITLEAGEQLRDGFNPDPGSWDPHVGYEGSTQLTPHLILTPRRVGLSSNLVIMTSRRAYRLYVQSVAGDEPTYLFFHYSLEAHAAAHGATQQPTPQATPFNAAAVCSRASMSGYDIAGASPWRPAVACNDGSHTYLQLEHSPTVPTDMPVIFAHADRQDHVVNWAYDAPNRVYRVDGVFDHLVLAVGHDRIDVTRKPNGPTATQPHPEPTEERF